MYMDECLDSYLDSYKEDDLERQLRSAHRTCSCGGTIKPVDYHNSLLGEYCDKCSRK